MRPLYTKSVKDVTQRKMRAVLTILGITIGVLGLTAISNSQGQLNSAFKYSQDAAGQPDITFYTSPAGPGAVQGIRDWTNVKTVEAVGFLYSQWQTPSGRKPVQIIGFPNLRNHQMNKFEVTSGSWPAPGQILMESSNSGLSPVHVGDKVTLLVRGTPRTLIVSGLTRTRGRPSSAFGQGQAYMRLADVQRVFQAPGVNFFMIRLYNYASRDADAKVLAHNLQVNNVTVLAATVGRDQLMNQILRKNVGGTLTIMQLLSIVALVLSVFLLLSTITTLVTEQVRIIGTMKAIGATRSAIMRNYLASVAIYGVVGTVLGFGLGLLVSYELLGYMAAMFTLDTGAFQINGVSAMLAVIVGIGVPLLAALLPLYFGTRMTVRDALTGYGLEETKHRGRFARGLGRALAFIPGVLQLGPRNIFRERTHALLSFVPGTMQLGVRNLFRKRTRALLTLLALSVSAVAFLAVQTTSYSFSTWLDHLLDTYHFNVQVVFTRPEPYDKVLNAIGTTPGLRSVERMSGMQVTTDWGNAQVTGVEPSSQLYRKNLVAGRWLNAMDTNVVVISTQARDASHLRVGDVITVRDKLHSAHWRIIGVAVDNDGILTKVGQMIVPLEETSRFRHLPLNLTSGLMIGATSQDQVAVDRLSRRLDDKLASAGMQATVMTSKQLKDTIASEVNVLNVMLYAVAVIVALVGAIGLFNALAMSVLERRREIGILRSMGATGRKVAGVFWTEGLSLGVLAWVLGVAIGVPAAYGFVWIIQTVLMPVPFAFNPFSVVAMLVFIAVIATLASLVPVWGAARVRIAQTLRYEG